MDCRHFGVICVLHESSTAAATAVGEDFCEVDVADAFVLFAVECTPLRLPFAARGLWEARTAGDRLRGSMKLRRAINDSAEEVERHDSRGSRMYDIDMLLYTGGHRVRQRTDHRGVRLLVCIFAELCAQHGIRLRNGYLENNPIASG